MRRLLTVLLVACAALATVVTPAVAHNVLTGSDPKNGAMLKELPERATLTFDQPVRAEFAKLALTLPGGAALPVTGVEVRGSKVIAPLPPGGPAGAYAIGYQIVSNDGHPVTGTIRFTVAGPSSATGATSPPDRTASPAPEVAPETASPGPGDPVTGAAASGVPQSGGGSWVWGLLVVALLVSGLGIAVVARRPPASGGHGA
ncbi:hypothetical protein GCM10009677_31080 [Sphaerisporangium rubeum]|uniref:CopC domain-containing protein n=1 Tax=Sphaerisporangium rubeum TaxID=321317 RepID=A0A7X0IEX7_9ACTN|nr:hypothetical protein [Sphaerisporangium rubeum]